MKIISRVTQIIICLALLVGLVGSAVVPGAAAAKAHPLLLQLAAQDPQQEIAVIVQKAEQGDRLEGKVAGMGGQVTKDLHIINAFGARMPAGVAAALSGDRGVRWVSLDAPVESAGFLTANETLLDRFDVLSYSNNNGSQPWSGSWFEINDDGLPSGGKIKIDRYELKIEDKNKGIYRSADLSMAQSAILSFSYRRDRLDKPTKYINLEVSTDNGVSWTLLYSFANGKDSISLPFSIDITPYISANTRIRFLTSPIEASKLYVDNFKIEYSYSYDDGRDCYGDAYTVRDEFTSPTYNSNDGTIQWASPWMEIDDREDPAQNPSAGLVQILNGELSLHNLNVNDPNPGLQRAINLTGSISCAKLSFDFRTSSKVSISDSIAIEISFDSGAHFIILDTIDWINGAVSGYRVYDITPFATPDTVIRIRVEQFYGLDGHAFYADNLQVSYAFGPEVPRCNVQTVGDDFQAYPSTYGNNTGSRNWLTSWQEIGESDGPAEGDILIGDSAQLGRSLVFWEDYTDGSWDPAAGIWRTADLSGASAARISFLYSRSSMMSDDHFIVEASPDGGATWYETGRISGTGTANVSVSDEGWRYAEFDITPYISSNTGIRLVTNYFHDDYWDNFSVDDIQVTFDDACNAMPPNTYLDTLGVPQLWAAGINGAGITVAVIDSGIALDDDFSLVSGEAGSERLASQVGFNSSAYTVQDIYGHGTHVAGIIGGNGTKSDGFYKGVAPGANLIGVKISDDYGMAYESDVVESLQWVYNNKDAYNIRVVNLSLNSTIEQSYHSSPLNAAVEILWFNGIVVVASVGNNGADGSYNSANAAPANDPFIITVGASDEQGTANRLDDSVASFSASSVTVDGFTKPDIIAPGRNIVSVLAASSWWRNDNPNRFVDGGYFRISGTSMAAPMVAGAAALLLQDEPNLTPDQVKYRLLHTGTILSSSSGDPLSYPYLDVYAAVTSTTTKSANTGLIASQLLSTGSDPITESVAWNSVAWNSVAWNSVAWNSVAWNSVAWNSVAWNSVFWEP